MRDDLGAVCGCGCGCVGWGAGRGVREREGARACLNRGGGVAPTRPRGARAGPANPALHARRALVDASTRTRSGWARSQARRGRGRAQWRLARWHPLSPSFFAPFFVGSVAYPRAAPPAPEQQARSVAARLPPAPTRREVRREAAVRSMAGRGEARVLSLTFSRWGGASAAGSEE